MRVRNLIADRVSAAQRLVQNRRQRDFYRRFFQPGDLVFDVGANAGDRSAVFLGLGAEVVAVEPQPACAEALKARFPHSVAIVPKGVADTPGVREMVLADAQTVSTMEPEWVTSMTASQRFGAMQWNETIEVEVTTLDHLIEEHGVPTFAKIDVEGFESSALGGLSRPLAHLSFEFVSERPEATAKCVRQLAELEMSHFNFSEGESMALASDEWVDAEAILQRVGALDQPDAWGDIYARSAPPVGRPT